MSERAVFEQRLEEYWSWIAVALFLLLTVDLFTSLVAAAVVGLEYESNPIMVWLLGQSVWLIVAIHLGAVVLASVLFYGIIQLMRDTEPRIRRVMMRWFEVCLGLLVAAGLFVFANNLSVIVLGGSLL
jgi:hypothetical protein